MTLAAATLTFISDRDHTLMRRFNRWQAPRWIRVWMLCATRGGDGWLWHARGLAILLLGGDQDGAGVRNGVADARDKVAPGPGGTPLSPVGLSEVEHTGDKIAGVTCSAKLATCPRNCPAPESGFCAPAFKNRTAG